MKPTSIVLADAQPFFRHNVFTFLNAQPETGIIIESCTGQQAVYQVSTHQPDILLTDIQLPDMDGLILIKEIARCHPAIGILVLSHLTYERDIWAAIQAGARGHLSKSCGQMELLTAITSIACGQIVLGANVAEHLTGLTAPQSTAGKPSINSPLAQLTRREWEVLALMGQGLSNCDIAAQLCLSPKTIRNYASHIFSKLQVKNRSQAILTYHQMEK